MASFAAYASQLLQKQPSPGAGDASLASSQPLFFSFSTDNDGGSRHVGRASYYPGGVGDAGPSGSSPFDDDDDPHLRASGATTRAAGSRGIYDADDGSDDEDPYLRLDEEDGPTPGAPRYAHQTAPLLGASASHDTSHSKGWLAHQAAAAGRSPSPSPSTASSDESGPPASLFEPHLPRPTVSSPRNARSPAAARPSPHPVPALPPPPPARAGLALSLTESLLPRDGRTRPVDVFSLPDPRHLSRGRRRYNDSTWIAVWLTGVGTCVFFSILLLFLTHAPKTVKAPLPYTSLLHTVPLLTILTFLAAGVAYAHIFLLRIFVKPVMIATTVFIPATLFISALWAFIGSFMWDANAGEPTWGETAGLRLFALVPLVLSLFTARRLLDLPAQLHTTSALLSLATRVLLQNPFLLALSPAVLLATLLASLPFLTLVFRLLLIGWYAPVQTGFEWRVKAWADWAIVGTCVIWLWSWGVSRGLIRVAAAGVVGSWYYADPQLLPPSPTSTHIIHAALARASQPSLGSIVLSALILTGVRALSLSALFVARVPAYVPLVAKPYAIPASVVVGRALAWVEAQVGARLLSPHALVYVGLTGDPFMPSARRARVLTSAAEGASGAAYRRKFKTEPPLTLLTTAPLTLTFPFALATYLFVAHTLRAPDAALGAALLAAGVTALVGAFCVGLVVDVSDALYVCYCIDREAGARRKVEVFEAFEYDFRRGPTSPSAGGPSRVGGHTSADLPPPATHARGDDDPHRRPSLPPLTQPLPEYFPEYTPSPSPSLSPPPPLPLPQQQRRHPAESEEDEEDEREDGGMSPASGYDLDLEMGRSARMPGAVESPSASRTSEAPGSARLDASARTDGTGQRSSALFPGSDLF